MRIKFKTQLKLKLTAKQEQGFSLVELLIALLLGSCMVALMLRHYLNVKKNHHETAATLAQAYDQLLITELVRTSIQQAGFTPCAPIRSLITPAGRTKTSLEAIAFPVGSKKALQISRMSEEFSILKKIYSANELLLAADIDLTSKERVVVADCFHAELVSIASARREGNAWRVRLSTPLKYAYQPPIYLGEWLQEQFYIDKNARGDPSLYYRVAHAEELSDKVNAMKVQRITKGQAVLVSIDFFLDQGPSWHIDTAVRA